jgi:maltose alpha-D-glucosyltransferase/alpha-amylase
VEERRRDWPPEAAAALSALVAAGPTLAARTAPLRLLSEGGVYRIRTHGDYHLGQVLRTHGTFAVVDFEGEPARPLPERRAKHAALRDVAGMLRSFGYAAHTAVRERPPAERPALGRWLDVWEHIVREDFRRSYLAGLGETPTRLVPAGDQPTRAVSAVFELEKALYEVRYELAHRPDWVAIPLAALSRMMAAS